jgi:membrane protease YdiL (CAAX protease family)
MSQKTLGLILVVVGIILLVVGLFADSLGIGSVAGFGWKQIAAVVAGAVVALAGIWLTLRKDA